MDSSSDNPKSKLPIKITVTSDIEPVEVDGFLTTDGNAFELTFDLGESKYEILLDGPKTRIKATGILSYELNFNGNTKSAITMPFGDMEFDMQPISCNCQTTNNGVCVDFSYVISFENYKDERTIGITATYV